MGMAGMSCAKNIEDRFPTLTQMLGKKKTSTAFQDVTHNGLDGKALFHQVECDLQYLHLHKHMDLGALSHAYKDQLGDKNEIIPAVYEIYTAALLASVSDEIQLHLPTTGSQNCDFHIKIHGCEIYGDVKTRYDIFPFNTSPTKDDSGADLYMASRATVDPHVAEAGPHPELNKPIPESTELRQRIEGALTQLPAAQPNLIVLGLIGNYDSPRTTRENLENALFGDYFLGVRDSKLIHSRHANGVFADKRYGEQITSVAWFCLRRSSQGMMRCSGIFFNSNAKYTLPKEVELILERLFDREKSLNRELERIIEKLKNDYQPKKIILFGSLAQGEVKEGSDIDLAIIKESDKRPLERRLEVASICQPSLAINFIVYTPKEFRERQKAGDFFVVEEILKRGRVLYER